MFLKLILPYFALLFCGCNNSNRELNRVFDQILIQYVNEMKKQELHAMGTGGGFSIENKINLIGVTYKYYQVMSINDARKLIVESADVLLNLINSSQNNRNYFEHFPVSSEITNTAILGMADTSKNYISSVSIIKGKIHYCTDDPERKIMPFVTVHVETFEEAKRILSEANYRDDDI